MATISIARTKGGCGKTTLALLLSAELALDGYQVALLDSDLNQHASAFGRKAKITGLTILPDIDERNVLTALRMAEDERDVVLIDLPGGSSTLALKALQRSHLVLVPTQASLPDVRDAVKTIAQIDDAQDLAGSPIARAILWTRLLPGFESRAARHVRESLEGKELPVLRNAVWNAPPSGRCTSPARSRAKAIQRGVPPPISPSLPAKCSTASPSCPTLHERQQASVAAHRR